MKNDERCKICFQFIRPGEPYSIIILPSTKRAASILEYVHKECEVKGVNKENGTERFN